MSGMTRRGLLRAGLAAWATAAVPGVGRAGSKKGDAIAWRNWAGDYACHPSARVAPRDEDELVGLLRATRGIVRPVGAGHSFSPIVPTEGLLVACDRLQGVLDVDATARTADVWAGTRLHALGAELAGRGQLLTTQPDIDDQVLAGALATSTHGTGPAFGSMSAYVEELTLVTPGGDRIVCNRERDAEIFQAARCSVGALGVVTRVRLANTAPIRLEERTRVVPIDELIEDAPRLARAHQHMEFMPLPYAGVGLLMTTDPTDSDAIALDEDPASVEQLRAAWQAVEGHVPTYRQVLAEALGTGEARRIGPAHLVRAHARYTRFREMEYAVPAEQGPACIREVLAAIERAALPVVFPLEVRYVAADEIWLSMFEGRDTCTISVHQYADAAHRPVFDALEPIFARYAGRPHWGKLNRLDAQRLEALYPRWNDFARVRRALDPGERMLSDPMRRLFLAEG